MDWLSQFTPSEIAAWVALAISLVVLAWDVFKWWRTGPRIIMRALPNMTQFPRAPGTPDTNIFVEISNNGNAPTTLKGLGIFHYDSFSKWVFRKASYQAVVAIPNPNFPLPHVIEVGKIWQGFIDQKPSEGMLRSGWFYVWCDCSHSKRLIRVRVTKLKQNEDSETQ